MSSAAVTSGGGGHHVRGGTVAWLQTVKVKNPDECEIKTHKMDAESGSGQFVIGRHYTSGCQIVDLMISRRHAVFKYEDNGWLVMNNSANEIRVNGSAVAEKSSRVLTDGDKVAIGPNDEYIWKFWVREPAAAAASSASGHSKAASSSRASSLSSALAEATKAVNDLEEKKKRLEGELSQLREKLEQDKKRISLWRTVKYPKLKRTLEKEGGLSKAEIKGRLDAAGDKFLGESIKRNEEHSAAFKSLDEEWKQVQKDLSEARETKAKAKARNEKVERLKAEADARAAFEYKAHIEKRLQEEQKILEEERQAKEKIARELADKDREINKLKRQLKRQQEQVDEAHAVAAAVLDAKEAEKGQECAAAAAKKAKSETLAKFSDELKCSVCEEVFINAVSLGCGHVFCQYCIDMWKRNQVTGPATGAVGEDGDHLTCPNCRKRLRIVQSALYIDNIIESLFQDQPQEVQEERNILLEERKNQVEVLKNLPPPPANRSSYSSFERWHQQWLWQREHGPVITDENMAAEGYYLAGSGSDYEGILGRLSDPSGSSTQGVSDYFTPSTAAAEASTDDDEDDESVEEGEADADVSTKGERPLPRQDETESDYSSKDDTESDSSSDEGDDVTGSHSNNEQTEDFDDVTKTEEEGDDDVTGNDRPDQQGQDVTESDQKEWSGGSHDDVTGSESNEAERQADDVTGIETNISEDDKEISSGAAKANDSSSGDQDEEEEEEIDVEGGCDDGQEEIVQGGGDASSLDLVSILASSIGGGSSDKNDSEESYDSDDSCDSDDVSDDSGGSCSDSDDQY